MEIILNIGLYHYLILAIILFCLGLWGVIVCRNVIKILICIELMLNAVALNFSAFASYMDIEKLDGLVFSLFITIFCVAQVVLGIVLSVSIYKYKKSIDIEQEMDLKG